MKQHQLFGFVLFFCVRFAGAQTLNGDSAVRLQEYTITADRFYQFNSGIKFTHTDSLYKQIAGLNSLSNLLAFQTPVFIKNYGPSQISTTSLRGSSAEHTAVLWNGINLQNSMNGQTDFSLIQSGLMDDIDLLYGGNTALYGAGAIGGAIMMNNKPRYQKGVGVRYQINQGSFGLWQHLVKVRYASSKAYIQVKAYNNRAVNNFTYVNQFGSTRTNRTQTHAAMEASGTLIETGYRISSNQSFDLRYWYQESNRQIPPTMGMMNSTATMKDSWHRINGEWTYVKNQVKWKARFAWLKDKLLFEDETTLITGNSLSHHVIGEIEQIRILNSKWQMNTGVNLTSQYAKHEQYTRTAQRLLTAVFASLQYKPTQKFEISANVREEFLNTEAMPITATVGAAYRFNKWLQAKAQFNKSYRIPTLNDLYWITGNPNLRPESGVGQELGIDVKFYRIHDLLTVQMNVFNRDVNNWIVWLSESGNLKPVNFKSVWSRGAELAARYTYCIGKWLFTAKHDFSYVFSTNEAVNSTDESSLGKQLIFIPRLTHQTTFIAGYGPMYVGYNQTYTGHRFITVDESTFLDDFSLANVFVGGGFKCLGKHCDLRGQALNVFNASYQILPSRPMPLFNYQVSLTIRFND
ncbi:MAG: TonB-dependent receptor plug domain-containing protein [Bacteroidota bacterium]